MTATPFLDYSRLEPITARRIDYLSSDPATVGPGKEAGDFRDVLALTDPLQRLARFDPIPAFLGAEEIGRHVGIDRARSDGVDPDAALAELGGEVAGQGVDRALGQCV